MTKSEFIEMLKHKLSSLPSEEVNDMMQEYSEYIDDKMSDGATEEEAVDGFGNIDDLAAEILDAYTVKKPDAVKVPTIPTGEEKSSADNILNGLGDFINSAATAIKAFYHNVLEHLTFSQFIRLLFIFIFAIILIQLPFAIIKSLILSLMGIFGKGIVYNICKIVLDLVFQLVYLICLVVISVSFYKNMTAHGDVTFSTLFHSPFQYFQGKNATYDAPTNETIDIVNQTIHTTVDTASQAIDEIIARAKMRTENREKGEQ